MLEGKVALVTGGSRGIGAATVRRLAVDGADVALTYAGSKDLAEDVADDVRAAGRRALPIHADSATIDGVPRAVDRVVAELGRVDILVNNAGIFPLGRLEDITVEEIDRAFATHVRAAFLGAQAAARHLPAGGRIITIGSNLAARVPGDGMSVYAASKSALTGLTLGLARDLGSRGITVNLVHPGNTDTDMNPADGGSADGQRAGTILGRYLEADDIAAAVAYLAGPGGRGATGTSLLVDAGSNV